MVKKARPAPRREESLSRDRIIEAAIELLDNDGEGGLTFRALSERLATGPGAIYWHIANKGDLLVAACDAVIAGVMAQGTTNGTAAQADAATPEDTIRALALAMFDAMNEHPWIGSALFHSAGALPTVRLLECIGQQVRALGAPAAGQWSATSALLHYVLGVGGQNAANRLSAQTRALDRDDFLGEVADAWSALDERDYPFTRSVADDLRNHDDRGDFLAGIDLILGGIKGTAKTRAKATVRKR
ncbi:TetR/AcrR family transcriptional regulator [Mitsuaria sp. 7]|uniref:TetR/AcrR family transcriptional regulator n=1 Tax=Mitsuaria sp. 7 TaxID=1658665 RepID=UPI0007DCF1EE|nr:TetR/AcrR family transcriptional regulator [Mitsuaria sp. 7]ANH67650.1 TetR family transcriptional regulator [Mitsuaria sp. 7]